MVALRDGHSVYRFLFLTPPQVTAQQAEPLRRTTYSFARLGEAERGQVKPLRLHVITAKPGDSVENLAEKMPLEGHKVERFRVLNGLTETQTISPGQKLKTVI